MVNPWAGQVALVINGQPQVLKLTLGALAELEESLGAGSLMALAERFESGGFSTRDVLALLAAGLRGAKAGIGPAELAEAEISGGPMRAAQAAAELLARAFLMPGET